MTPCTLPSTASPARNTCSSSRYCVAALRMPLRDRMVPATGRDDDGLNAIADGRLDIAVLVLQLGNVNLRLALSADADQGHLRPDGNNGSLDGLGPARLAAP